MFFFGIIIGVSTWGITKLVSESNNLLNGLNVYVEEAYTKISNFIGNVNFDRINISDDVKKAIEEADNPLLNPSGKCILFIDEIHRFNKLQQDALLPYVEDGIFIGL